METEQVIIERDIFCEMRDGICLFSNIYRPSKEGTYPVLLSRLPYNKNLPSFSHRYIDPIRLALAGYVVIIQDVRGRFASEGKFDPFIQEFQDGYDTVEWAASLPYSNGNVGMFGLSYYGFTQLYAAIQRPPSLKAIFPAMTGSHFRGGLFNRDGAAEPASIKTWILDSVAPDYLKRKQGIEYAETLEEIKKDLNSIEELYEHTPIEEWPPFKKHPQLYDFFEKYFAQDLTKELQSKTNGKTGLWDIDIPAYHLAGWYDSFLGPTLMNYQEMSQTNNNQKLIIGPWGHGLFTSDIGERNFGIDSSGFSIDGKDDITSLHQKWFDYWLKNVHSSLTEEFPVKVFIMGINQWRLEREWPLKRTNYVPFYFHRSSQKTAGLLNREKPDNEKFDTFTHDPKNPVPTKGGGTLFYNCKNAGPRDQKEMAQRKDVLIYTSEPVQEPLEVTGPVTVRLWASSEGNDTYFTAKLVDIFPDGRGFNLTDGIVRARCVDDSVEEVKKYEIDLWATSNVFLPEHSIRIEIASSNFPRYDVNPSEDQILEQIGETTIKQRVYHEDNFPSSVLLPIIPGDEHKL